MNWKLQHVRDRFDSAWDDIRIVDLSTASSGHHLLTIATLNPQAPHTHHAREAGALMAAAPKLLTELKDLAGFVRRFGSMPDRAAFMKAAASYLAASDKAITLAAASSWPTEEELDDEAGDPITTENPQRLTS